MNSYIGQLKDIEIETIKALSTSEIGTNRNITALDRIIAKNLKKAREKSNFSRAYVATMVNISQQQLGKYENAINRIPASRLFLFSYLYNVPVQDFFECHGETA